MKNRTGVIILVVICLALGITLIVIKKQAAELQHKDADDMANLASLSNKLVNTEVSLNSQVQTNGIFERDLVNHRKALLELTNNFAQVSANLSQASANLAKSEAALKTMAEEMKQREARIAELESQNQTLDKRALELSAAITNLTAQIEETKRKLAASEGDKSILETSLKRLLSEKAELERQFNDMTVLRAQVSKLKEELTIARRLQWIRQGVFAATEQKGAQKLMEGITPPQAQPATPKPAFDLNVEVGSDGTVKVVPPLTNAPVFTPIPQPSTNAPAATNPPPK